MLDPERNAGTISGRVAFGGAPATEFFGGLELIDRLEHVVVGSKTAVSREWEPSW